MTEGSKHFKIRLTTISNNINGYSKKTKQGTWKLK